MDWSSFIIAQGWFNIIPLRSVTPFNISKILCLTVEGIQWACTSKFEILVLSKIIPWSTICDLSKATLRIFYGQQIPKGIFLPCRRKKKIKIKFPCWPMSEKMGQFWQIRAHRAICTGGLTKSWKAAYFSCRTQFLHMSEDSLTVKYTESGLRQQKYPFQYSH